MSNSVITDVAFYKKNKLEASNALGTQYASFKSAMYALALSSPQKYFAMRDRTIFMLKEQYLKTIHENLYDLLTIGKIEGQDAVSSDGVNFRPNMPLQQVNQACLDAASSINDILDHFIEKLLPVEMTTIMSKRLGVIGKEIVE